MDYTIREMKTDEYPLLDDFCIRQFISPTKRI